MVGFSSFYGTQINGSLSKLHIIECHKLINMPSQVLYAEKLVSVYATFVHVNFHLVF